MNNLVSVIIPVYNVSRYLPQCLESVLNQTYKELEIIIVNDGSTDDSGLNCEEYAGKDSRIRVFHTEHRGLAASRNLGIDNAKGSFILFVDSDDWIELHTIDTLVRTSVRTGADVVVARNCFEYVGKTVHSKAGKKRKVGQIVDLDENGRQVQVFQGNDILTAYVNGEFRDLAWNKLYRAELFSEIRFPDGRNYEDVGTTWRLMKILSETGGTAAVWPEELFHFRMRKGSITHTMTMDNIADCWTSHYERYEGLADYRDLYIGSCFVAVGRMWMNYSRFSGEEKRRAAATVREMQSFSREIRHKVMRGKYPRYVKMVCLLSQSKAPLAMAAGFLWGKLRQVRKMGEEGKLFV